MIYKLTTRLIKKTSLFIQKHSKSEHLKNLFEMDKNDATFIRSAIYRIDDAFIKEQCENDDLMKPAVGKKSSDFPFYSSYT